MTKRVYKERRLYFAENCEKCGNQFQSFKRSKIKHGLCRKCRKNEVNPNQVTLFGSPDATLDVQTGEMSMKNIRAGECVHTIERTSDQIVEKCDGVPVGIIGFVKGGF